jgi:hypothetical protein
MKQRYSYFVLLAGLIPEQLSFTITTTMSLLQAYPILCLVMYCLWRTLIECLLQWNCVRVRNYIRLQISPGVMPRNTAFLTNSCLRLRKNLAYRSKFAASEYSTCVGGMNYCNIYGGICDITVKKCVARMLPSFS